MGWASLIFPASLLPNERIIFKTNPHWLAIMVPEIALAVFGALIVKYLPSLWSETIPCQQWILTFLGAAFSFTMIVVFLNWICTRYYLTNHRVIEERGIIGKRIMSVWVDRIQDVTCEFGILGRIFGFGDIEIESAGNYGKITFGFLPKPRKLKLEIERAILNFHERLPGI